MNFVQFGKILRITPAVSDSQHTHTNMNTLTNHRIFHQIHAIFSLISVISNHSIFFLVQHSLSRHISCFSWTRLSDFVRDHPILLRFFLPSIMELSSSSSWLVMLSWILAHLLWTLLTWIFDQSGASRNLLHSTTILLITPRKFSRSMKHGSNQLTLTILFHLWHLLVIQSCTLLVSLVKVVVLLSFFDHSWNSNFSALATYLHLNLSNLWLLNFQLAIRKPSFLTSIALHLPKFYLFWRISKSTWNFCSVTIWAHH